MANQKGDTTSTGHFWNRCIDAVNKKFETFSFWNKASDTEFDDGSNAETKVGAFKGITSDLNTTTTGYAADMTTVAKLNSSFVSNIYVDEDGNLHKVQGGADTVLNFSGAKYPEKITLYSRSNVVIPVNGKSLSFNMTTVHPYVNFYVEKYINGAFATIFTQNAGGNYSGNKTVDITGCSSVRFRTSPYGEYGDAGCISINNIEVK